MAAHPLVPLELGDLPYRVDFKTNSAPRLVTSVTDKIGASCKKMARVAFELLEGVT